MPGQAPPTSPEKDPTPWQQVPGVGTSQPYFGILITTLALLKQDLPRMHVRPFWFSEIGFVTFSGTHRVYTERISSMASQLFQSVSFLETKMILKCN